MTNKHAISFSKVSFSINQRTILNNITGTIAKHKITTLVGPSGSGKTTLLKLCNGLISATSGSIKVKGKPIDSYDPIKLRRAVGLALQNAPMIRGTVYDNLALPRTLQNETLSEKEATIYLERVALERTYLHHQANELSGGQRQKVSIARTLVNESEILLLDEITAALDPHSVEEIEQLVMELQAEFGVTILWITHHLDQARKIGHEAWILSDGELVESGSIDILTTPKTNRAAQFISGGKQ